MPFANLGQVIRYQGQRLGPRPALLYREYGLYHARTWEDYAGAVASLACGLIEVGIRPGDRVALIGENSPDWLVADLGILSAGAVTVTPHAPLTAAQIQYQLHDADVVWAIVSTRAQLDKLRSVRHQLPALRGVVVFDPHTSDQEALSWEAFLQHGRSSHDRLAVEMEHRLAQTGPDSLATVMYTSGTTGMPKGVMLTHGNLLSNALACLEVQPHGPEDVVLGWLPLTHIYARTVDHYLTLVAGIQLALAESAETLVEELAFVQPTHLAAVPRFYEKVLAAVAAPDPKETGKRLRRIFGPRIDWISSGGAPLPVPIAEAYHAAGLQLMQGYGLTESSPVISFNSKTHHRIGTVGRPLPGVEVRIGDDGEVLTRGPHVMKGYWKDEAATRETIRDGWLHTGDLGTIDEQGFLSITGRKKDLMVLSNGKKVVPTHLEGLLITDPCIDQAIVVGEGRNFLAALLVPNWENLRAALPGDPAPEAVVAFLQQRCRHALRDLSHMEQIKKVFVVPRPFSVEADEMTVSLKLRRGVILNHYAKQLEELYRTHPGEPEL